VTKIVQQWHAWSKLNVTEEQYYRGHVRELQGGIFGKIAMLQRHIFPKWRELLTWISSSGRLSN